MLTGERAFRRESEVETMMAILREDPLEDSAVRKALPSEIEETVTHCLEKNPEERFQSARDLAFALRVAEGRGSGAGRSDAATRPVAPRIPEETQHGSPRPGPVFQVDHQHRPLRTHPDASRPQRPRRPGGVVRDDVQPPIELHHPLEVDPRPSDGFERPHEHTRAVILQGDGEVGCCLGHRPEATGGVISPRG